MKRLWVVMVKELRDLMRDRRTVGIALLMGPVLTPALMLGLFAMTAKKQMTQMEKTLELPVVGAEHAPNLVSWLRSNNITIEPAPADPEAAVLSQDEDVVLRIPADFPSQWRESRGAVVEVLHDASRQDARIPVERVAGLLEQYSRSVGAMRLLARGVSPSVTEALQVSRQDLSTAEARRGMLLSLLLPYLLILSSFLGGAYLVIDVTAGERERQSLEPLLATPASRSAIMSGKIAAACAFGWTSLLLTLLAFKAGFALVPMGNMSMDVSFLAMGKILLILTPMLLIGTTLLTLIAASVKSVKEAQSYMTVLILLPMIPTFILMVNPVKDQLWMLAVPFLSQNQLITKVVRVESIGVQEWAMYLAAGFGLGALLWGLAARMYHREKLAISA